MAKNPPDECRRRFESGGKCKTSPTHLVTWKCSVCTLAIKERGRYCSKHTVELSSDNRKCYRLYKDGPCPGILQSILIVPIKED